MATRRMARRLVTGRASRRGWSAAGSRCGSGRLHALNRRENLAAPGALTGALATTNATTCRLARGRTRSICFGHGRSKGTRSPQRVKRRCSVYRGAEASAPAGRDEPLVRRVVAHAPRARACSTTRWRTPGSAPTTSASTRCCGSSGRPHRARSPAGPGMRPTTVSAALRRMAGRRHSVQHDNPDDGRSYHNPDDGRSYLVGLSPRGAAAHAAAGLGRSSRCWRDVDQALQPDASIELRIGPPAARRRAARHRRSRPPALSPRRRSRPERHVAAVVHRLAAHARPGGRRARLRAVRAGRLRPADRPGRPGRMRRDRDRAGCWIRTVALPRDPTRTHRCWRRPSSG